MTPAKPPLVQTGVRVPLPDGVRLATDVFRPAHGGPAPTLLLRTYLGCSRHLEEGLAWAREGFAFVVQDVRGRYGSEGEWDPCVHERADGAAALSWVAEQPWCDGRVVLAGGSYGAFTAWAAALSGHPAARAVIAAVPATARVNFEPGGVLKLYNHASWWMTHGEARTERTGLFAAMMDAEPGLLAGLPVAALPERFWAGLPAWMEGVLAGPAPGGWAVRDEELAACPLATMHLGGWHDPFVRDTVRQWEVAGSALMPRPERALVLGPWTHELRAHEPGRYGERDYGPASRLPLGRLQVRWLRRVLGIGEDGPGEPRMRLFLTGANRWLAGERWPATAPRSWYAAPGGRLAEAPPGVAGCGRFVYDPLDPFPGRSGPVDQSDLAARPDSLRFSTGPLAAPLTWAGAPSVTLWATTDAPSTDWVARLHEELPDGRTLYLGHGLVVADAPGEAPRAWTLSLPPLAITVPAGHGLCLEITSSTFPEHARNLNTGACRYTTAETRPARQEVHFGPATPTVLTLPVTLEEAA